MRYGKGAKAKGKEGSFFLVRRGWGKKKYPQSGRGSGWGRGRGTGKEGQRNTKRVRRVGLFFFGKSEGYNLFF